MDASEICSKRLNAKQVIFPPKGEFTFPIADGRIKTPGGDQDLRTSTLVRHRPIQGDSHVDFLGESDQKNRLVQWSNVTLFLAKDLSGVYSSVTCYTRGRIWKGDILIADIEELEQMDASEIHATKLNAREALTPMRGENFMMDRQNFWR